MTLDFNETTQRIKDIMYGLNYEVYLDVEIFDGSTPADFKNTINEKYPEADTDSYPLLQLDKVACFDDIKKKLGYRGDVTSGSGLALTPEVEITLRELQQKYFNYIEQFIDAQTTFFLFECTFGLPGAVAFWEYRYVLFCHSNKILFVYGSGSD